VDLWVQNQDFSINSDANPAVQGSVAVLHLTGAGQTSPASFDGEVWRTTGGLVAGVSAELTSADLNVRAAFPAPVLYAGPVPAAVSGIQQLNMLVPDLPAFFFSPLTGGSGLLSVTIGTQTLAVPVVVK
jgi:uncharacterized protein (TIGR03437 family)